MTQELERKKTWRDWAWTKAWLEGAHSAARRFRKEVVDVSPQHIRIALEWASKLNPGPWGGVFEVVSGNQWKGAEVTWKGAREGTIVWIHGGAFAFGSPRVYRAAAVHLARASRCKVLLPEYRLAPEWVYPCAHDDVYHAIQELTKGDQSVVLMGDSAGGNLLLSAVRRLQQERRDLNKIAGIALLSPWCDLRESAASIRQNEIAMSPFDAEDSISFSQSYLSGHPSRDPFVSPLIDLDGRGWPPVFLEWSEDEFLAPDVSLLHHQLKSNGLHITTRTEPHAVHGWQLLPDVLPEARRSSQSLGDWVRDVLHFGEEHHRAASRARSTN